MPLPLGIGARRVREDDPHPKYISHALTHEQEVGCTPAPLGSDLTQIPKIIPWPGHSWRELLTSK